MDRIRDEDIGIENGALNVREGIDTAPIINAGEEKKTTNREEGSTIDHETATSASNCRELPQFANFLKAKGMSLTNTAIRNPRDYPVLGRFRKKKPNAINDEDDNLF